MKQYIFLGLGLLGCLLAFALHDGQIAADGRGEGGRHTMVLFGVGCTVLEM